MNKWTSKVSGKTIYNHLKIQRNLTPIFDFSEGILLWYVEALFL
jgi:hypothetical protein